MKFVDLTTPYASAVIDGDTGLVGSDIFPSTDEYGYTSKEYSHDELGSMATSALVDIEDFFGSISISNEEEI